MADEQRSLALGAQSVLFRMFGTIPGPILFGLIFDSTCIYWQYGCAGRGNCWVYENNHLSQRALSLALLGIGVNFIFSFLSWLVYPKNPINTQPLSNIEEENDSLEMESKSRPTSRSVTTRMDSHCSEDILLES